MQSFIFVQSNLKINLKTEMARFASLNNVRKVIFTGVIIDDQMCH